MYLFFRRIKEFVKSIYNSAIYQLHEFKGDIVAIFLISILFSIAVYQIQLLIDPSIFNLNRQDVWFDSDAAPIFNLMTDAKANQSRTSRHPLITLLLYTPILIERAVFHLQDITAIRVFVSFTAFIWIGTLYILLRLICAHQLDTVLFTALGAVSSAAIFGFAIPESFALGSISIMLALISILLLPHWHRAYWWGLPMSFLTLSVSTTNWMFGILAVAVSCSWKRALKITGLAYLLVLFLWHVQKHFFPTTAAFLINKDISQDLLGSGGLFVAMRSFFFHTIVMPGILIVKKDWPDWSVITTQHSLPGSGGVWGTIAIAFWSGLLGLGFWACLSIQKHFRLRVVIGLTLVGQVALHSIFGTETFLYALHFAPLLLVIAAMSTLTSFRHWALILTILLVLSTAFNNLFEFGQAAAFLKDSAVIEQPRS